MSDIDPYHEDDFELVLGNKQLFFLAVLVFAVFFAFGYLVGYNRGEAARDSVVAANIPAPVQSTPVQTPVQAPETPRPPQPVQPAVQPAETTQPAVRPTPSDSGSVIAASTAGKQPDAKDAGAKPAAPRPQQPLRAGMDEPETPKPAPSRPNMAGTAPPPVRSSTAPPPVRSTAPPVVTQAAASPSLTPAMTIRPAKPTPPPVRATPPAPAAGALPKGAYLQMLARRERAPAEKFAAEMRARNYSVIVDDQGDGWFRVVIGPLNDEALLRFQERLDADGIQWFVRKI